MQLHAGDLANPRLEAVCKRERFPMNRIDAFAFDIGNTCKQACDAMRIQRARLQMLRHEIGLATIVAVRARTALFQRRDVDAVSHA